jgi:RND family efflux transporter MFP subunit
MSTPCRRRSWPLLSVTERHARQRLGRRTSEGGFSASALMPAVAAAIVLAGATALGVGGFLPAPATAQPASAAQARTPSGSGPDSQGAGRPVSPAGTASPATIVAPVTPVRPIDAAAASPTAPAAPPVRVLLTPARETTLVAQMVGRIERLGGELGGSFKEGAPLVVFDCAEQQARLRMADAEHDAAAQQHETKMRLQALDAAGDAEVKLAATGVVRAQAQIELARQQATHCRIDAPFTGRIVKLHVRESQGVAVGQPLLELVSAGPLKLRLNAPSKWLSWLKPGVKFRITIDETGRTYPAVVSAINARVDAVSQSIEIEGRVRGAYPELLAGMSGTAAFARAR